MPNKPEKSHATWGGRFKKPLDPRVAQFNASLAFDQVLLACDVVGSQAHAAMLGKQGIISPAESEALCKALENIKQEIQQAGFPPTCDAFEDIHMFIEHLLIEKLGDLGKKLHTGRSRNDQVALDLRLFTRDTVQNLRAELGKFLAVLNGLETKHHADWMPGYTHLQQAQPVRLGQVFGAYHAMFSRDTTRLEDWERRMNYSPLGAGALAGSSLPLDRHAVAQSLGFAGIIENTLDAVSDRDFVIELCSALALLMMHLSRLSEDLILWSTQEFGFVTLDDAFSTGSSLMPNKKNPDVLELIRGKTGRVFGHLMAILTVMKGLPLAYNKDMQEDKEGLFDALNTVFACIRVITPFLESVQFNTHLMQQRSQEGFLDATALLESFVMRGIPFRDAHHQVGLLVGEALEKSCTLKELEKKLL